MAKCLLQPRQEDRDDDRSLESFAKADEEYYENQGVSVQLCIASLDGWLKLTRDREDIGSHLD